MKTVFIDSQWIGYRALHTTGGLSHGELKTGVIFGFFEILRSVCFDPKVLSNEVHLCFESRQSYRRDVFPAYKIKRERRTPEEIEKIVLMKQQMEHLRKEILPSIGFRCHRQIGLESDDLMAQGSSQLQGKEGLIITADNDLFQCITNTVHWYDQARQLYLDPSNFAIKMRVGPNDWGDVKSIAGCDTDEVPGVRGVGEKTAIDYIWKLLPQHYQAYKSIISAEGKKIIARNRRLVILPHTKTTDLDLTPPKYNASEFFTWANQLGFASYLDGSRRTAWENFFAGRMTESRQVPRKRGLLA